MSLQNSVLLYIFSICLVVYSKKLPSYIEVCPRHPQIGDCIKKNIEIIREHFCKGIPSLFIPSFNPIKIPEATLTGPNNFSVTFTDVEIYNAEKVIIENMDFNTENWNVKFTVLLREVRLKSHYKVKGRLLVLQLDGSGPADGNFTDIRASFNIKLTPYEKNGKEHLKLNSNTFDLELGKPHLQFDNLFGNNEQLNEQTNRIINDNSQVIIEDLKPVVKEIIFQFGIGIISKAFEKYNIDELFPLP